MFDKKLFSFSFFLLVIFLFTTSFSGATVLYENDLIESDNLGFVSNIGGVLSADNFSLTKYSTIESLKWYGMYGSASSDTVDSFDIRIFNFSGSELFSLNESSVNKSYSGVDDAFGERIYEYELPIPDWALPADEYLLSISNQNSDFSDWFWADGTGGEGVSYYWDSSSWIADDIGTDTAFVLNGTPIPEPSTWVLLAGGFLSLCWYRRNHKNT